METPFFNTQPAKALSLTVLFMLSIGLATYAYLNLTKIEHLDIMPATITVEGQGEVLAVPDIGQFSFSVRVEEETAELAQTESGTKVNEILAYLREAGIDDKDIKTQNYNLWPRYDFIEQACVFGRPCPPSERVQTGFEVSQTVSVKVRETVTAGEIISGVGERGATNISGLQFTIDDADALRAEARAQAIADAKTKAELLANQLGVDIVRLIGFYEGGEDYYQDGYMRSMSLEMADSEFGGPELPVGEESTKSTVNLTYEIK